MASIACLTSANSAANLSMSFCNLSFSATAISKLVRVSSTSSIATLCFTSKSFMHLFMSVATLHCSSNLCAMRFSSTPKRFLSPACINKSSMSRSSRSPFARSVVSCLRRHLRTWPRLRSSRAAATAVVATVMVAAKAGKAAAEASQEPSATTPLAPVPVIRACDCMAEPTDGRKPLLSMALGPATMAEVAPKGAAATSSPRQANITPASARKSKETKP
mmetsp:Transcript_64549/g.162421  ORF Transcript_64549/g.162421 Transcript_64549/m.162421 type:complete len:219 (+) Transcript_64549:765-1421(+)